MLNKAFNAAKEHLHNYCNEDDLATICGWYYPKQRVIYDYT